jgi:hypothetical protein
MGTSSAAATGAVIVLLLVNFAVAVAAATVATSPHPPHAADSCPVTIQLLLPDHMQLLLLLQLLLLQSAIRPVGCLSIARCAMSATDRCISAAAAASVMPPPLLLLAITMLLLLLPDSAMRPVGSGNMAMSTPARRC